MSVKRKSFSADFKAKLVLEVLEGEKTVNEIASIAHISEAKVYGILGALKILTFWDKAKRVITNHWFIGIVTGIVATVVASFITMLPVVSVATGAVVGTAFLYTTTNVVLAIIATMLALVACYHIEEAILDISFK